MIGLLLFVVLLPSSSPLEIQFTCSCPDAPTGKGCGSQELELCDTNSCDGKCLSTTSTTFLQRSKEPTDSILPNIESMPQEHFSESNIPSDMDIPPQEHIPKSDVAITEPKETDRGEPAEPADPAEPAETATDMTGMNQLLTPQQVKELARAAALSKANANLAQAENDPIKNHGLRPNAASPANIHVTMIYANNNACQKNVTECEWVEYPVMNYGGDLPIGPKDVNDRSDMHFMVSCIVCSLIEEKKMCTRPEFNINVVNKHTVGQSTRTELIDIAKEISEIEKKCKRTTAPYDQRLNHLRNQHPGLAQMFGMPPPVSSPKSEDAGEESANKVPSVEMLRSQR